VRPLTLRSSSILADDMLGVTNSTASEPSPVRREYFVESNGLNVKFAAHEQWMSPVRTTKFLIPFDSGVVVITDWNSNNWLDNRRVKATVYTQEKELLGVTKDKKYVLLSSGLASAKRVQNSIEEKSVEENRKEENNKYFLFNKNKQEYEHNSFSSKKESTLWATEKKDWLGEDFFALEVHEKLSDGSYKKV